MVAQEAQVALSEAAVELAAQAACAKLAGSPTPAEQALLLAQLVVLLGQLDGDMPVPQCVLELVPQLVAHTASGADEHVQNNATALLSSLMGVDEPTWQRLVLQEHELVPALSQLLASCCGSSAGAPTMQAPPDATLCINVLTALTAAAQGGVEGAQAVLDAGALPHVHTALLASQPSETFGGEVKVMEAAADVLCQLGTVHECRPVLVSEGSAQVAAQALGGASGNLRAQLLMLLGMLLPDSEQAQLQVASCAPAVAALLAAMRQPEDTDVREVARVLFTSLAKVPACKQALEDALHGA